MRFATILHILLLIIAISFSSCSEDTSEELIGSSRLVVNVNIDSEVHFPDGTVAQGSSPIIAPDISQLSLRLTKKDGAYTHLWQSIADYPAGEPLRPGTYLVEVFSSTSSTTSFPFYGHAEVVLVDGSTSSVTIPCQLADGYLSLETSPQCSVIFKECSITAHSFGQDYIEVSTDLTPITPGQVSLMATITTLDDRQVRFGITNINFLKPSELWQLCLDAQLDPVTNSPVLVLNYGGGAIKYSAQRTIDDQLLSAQAPVLTPDGFISGQTMTIVEGCVPDPSCFIQVSEATPMSLVLSTSAPQLISPLWPVEVDLCHLTPNLKTQLEELGLKLSFSSGSLQSVDVTEVLKNIKPINSTDRVQFNIIASGLQGTLSNTLSLSVQVEPAQISIQHVTPIIIGSFLTNIDIQSNAPLDPSSFSLEVYNEVSGQWQHAEIESCTPNNSGSATTLSVRIPSLVQNSVKLRVLYLGQERDRVEIPLISPQYSISVDAFALLAVVNVQADTPELTELITSCLNIYVDGSPNSYVARYPDENCLIVGGLNPDHSYLLKATIYRPDATNKDFTPEIKFRTEQMLEVPNGSFEKIENGIKYSNLPSGGRYSQSIVDIYNQQNYLSFDLSQPKGWANTNDKQFCKSASNHNSWYMLPGIFTTTDHVGDGAYAVTIRSTAWDLNGPEIPDYRQTSTPGVPYNINVPNIAQRAAGKLFLGEYYFDPARMQESYIEGVSFQSRPSSLNGYYKFIPSLNDYSEQGHVNIEILGIGDDGVETVIGGASSDLQPAITFKTFSIPIQYYIMGVKATKLKIMFSSSNHLGSIAEEAANVTTTADIPTSSSIGGILTIDELTFTY